MYKLLDNYLEDWKISYLSQFDSYWYPGYEDIIMNS